MADFPCLVDEDAVIGSHAGVDHADVGGDEADFGAGGGVYEWGRGLLLRREDDAVGGFDAEGCYALVDGVEGVLCVTLVFKMF